MLRKLLVSVCAAMMTVCLALSLAACVNFTNYVPHRHTYGEWEITQVPTATETGKATRTCSSCEVWEAGHKITIALPELTNSLYTVTFIDEADCEHGGTAEYALSYAGEAIAFTVDVPVGDHAYGEWIEEIPASNYEAGVKGHYTCSVCGKHFDEDYNEMTDEDLVIEQLINYQADENAYYLVGTFNGEDHWAPYTDDMKLSADEGNLGAIMNVTLAAGDQLKVVKGACTEWYSCAATEGVNTVVEEDGDSKGNGVIIADGIYNVYLNNQGVVYIAKVEDEPQPEELGVITEDQTWVPAQSQLGEFAEAVKLANGIEAVAAESKTMSIDDGGSTTYEDTTYDYRLKLNGKASASNRYVKIVVGDAATITVYAMSGNNSKDRPLNFYDGAISADKLLKSVTITGGGDTGLMVPAVYEAPEAGEYLIGSGDSGINVYAIIVKMGIEQPATYVADENAYYLVGTINGEAHWAPYTDELKLSDYEGNLGAIMGVSLKEGDQLKVVKGACTEWYSCAATEGVNTVVTEDGDSKGNGVIIADGTYNIFLNNQGQVYIANAENEPQPAFALVNDEEAKMSADTWTYWYVQSLDWQCGDVVTISEAKVTPEGQIVLTYVGGSNNWCAQLFYKNSQLEDGKTYTLTCTINASAAHSVVINGKGFELVAGDNEITVNYTEGNGMSSFDGQFNQTATAVTLKLSGFNWTEKEVPASEMPWGGEETSKTNTDKYYYWSRDWDPIVTVTEHTYEDGTLTIEYSGAVSEFWDVQLFNSVSALEAGKTYTLSFTLNSTVAGKITVKGTAVEIVAGDNNISVDFTEDKAYSSFSVQFGTNEGNTKIEAGKFVFTDITFEEKQAQQEDPYVTLTFDSIYGEGQFFFFWATSNFDMTTVNKVTANGVALDWIEIAAKAGDGKYPVRLKCDTTKTVYTFEWIKDDVVIASTRYYFEDANAYYLVGKTNGITSWTPYSDDYKLSANDGNLGAIMGVELKEGDEIKVYKAGQYYSCAATEGVNTVVESGEGMGNGVIIADGTYNIYLNDQGVVYIAKAETEQQTDPENPAFAVDENAYYLVGKIGGEAHWTPYTDDLKLSANEGNLGAIMGVMLKAGDEIKVYKNGTYYSCAATNGVNTVVESGDGAGNGVIIADGVYNIYLNSQGVVYIQGTVSANTTLVFTQTVISGGSTLDSSNCVANGVYIVGGSGNNKSATIDNEEYTYAAKLGGAITATKNYIAVTVTGPCTIKVYFASNSDSQERTVGVFNSADKTDIVSTGTASIAGASFSANITAAGTYYIGSTNSSVNIFAIEIIYPSAT